MEGGEGSKPQLIRGSLVKPEGKLQGTLLTPRTTDSKPSTTSGKEPDMSSHIAYLNEVVAPLAKEYGGFGPVLGGYSPLSTEDNFTLDISQFSKDPRNAYSLASDLRAKTFAKAWNTGVDLNTLMRNSPDSRYKFYLSLDLSSPDKMKAAKEMFGKILELAKKGKVSLFSKSEDHTYDSCNLYTWDRRKLEDIVKTLYPQYPDIWLTTHHFFQAPIEGVNPMHIGWVQEPLGGKNGNSHSSRMRILGKTLDTSDKALIDTETYKRACRNASVNPQAPWLIAKS